MADYKYTKGMECPYHPGEHLQEFEKDGKVWYSHKDPKDGWCNPNIRAWKESKDQPAAKKTDHVAIRAQIARSFPDQFETLRSVHEYVFDGKLPGVSRYESEEV